MTVFQPSGHHSEISCSGGHPAVFVHVGEDLVEDRGDVHVSQEFSPQRLGVPLRQVAFLLLSLLFVGLHVAPNAS